TVTLYSLPRFKNISKYYTFRASLLRSHSTHLWKRVVNYLKYYTHPETGKTLNVAHDIDGLNESAKPDPKDLEAVMNGDIEALNRLSQSSFSTIGRSLSPEEQKAGNRDESHLAF
ncbi:MAG: hypothetical protein ACKO34_07095, partial [Vampirovibrionales bacterium]